METFEYLFANGYACAMLFTMLECMSENGQERESDLTMGIDVVATLPIVTENMSMYMHRYIYIYTVA